METKTLEIEISLCVTDRTEKRFKSTIAGLPFCTGLGRTPQAAIGDLIRSHPERFAHDEVRQALPNSFVRRDGGWYVSDTEPSETLGMNAWNCQELFRIRTRLVEPESWPVKCRLLASLTAQP